MAELFDLERLISIRIIQEDSEAILSLLKTERNSVLCMELIPYYALFVQSCQEYMGQDFVKGSIGKDIKDIRNHIKAYSENFGKSERRVLAIDDKQDNDFKSQLKMDFLKKMNIHFNFGSYWTEDRHIVGNTQQLADFLSIDSLFAPDLGVWHYQLGYEIGSFVSSVRNGFANTMNCPPVKRLKKGVPIDYFCDINTNVDNNFFSNTLSKQLNLFFIHLLCNMNFVKYMLRPMFVDGNTWVFRLEYIVTYYTLRGLQRLKNYCENNTETTINRGEIEKILNQGNPLFDSKFRNCMMHYDLVNQDVVSPKNVGKPFYGIVETCFNGMDYYAYLVRLRELSDKIIEYLEKWFDFSKVHLQLL